MTGMPPGSSTQHQVLQPKGIIWVFIFCAITGTTAECQVGRVRNSTGNMPSRTFAACNKYSTLHASSFPKNVGVPKNTTGKPNSETKSTDDASRRGEFSLLNPFRSAHTFSGTTLLGIRARSLIQWRKGYNQCGDKIPKRGKAR